ncbi:hypothetical protein D3C81_1197210 [compost metagenome]
MVIKVFLIYIHPVFIRIVGWIISHPEDLHRIGISRNHCHTNRLQISIGFLHRFFDIILYCIVNCQLDVFAMLHRGVNFTGFWNLNSSSITFVFNISILTF